MGFVIFVEGVKMDLEKIKATMEWPSPKSVFEVSIFHGFVSFYRKFIKNFGKINAPIIKKIKKEKHPFRWTTKQRRIFNC